MFANSVPAWPVKTGVLATPELLTDLPDVAMLRSLPQELGLWTDVVDTRRSLAELFTDLPGLLEAAVDLDDARLATVTRGRTLEVGSNHASEGVRATRFEEPELHITRGVTRVVGDPTAYAERVLAGAEGREDWLHVVEAEAEYGLLHLTLSTPPDHDGFALSNFYRSIPETIGPAGSMGRRNT